MSLAALRRARTAAAFACEPSAFYAAAADFLRRRLLAPCGAGRLYLDLRADGSIAPCVDLPAVATVDDLAAGRRALETAHVLARAWWRRRAATGAAA